MKNNLLKTLALLKANWNEPNKKDYLDIFLPILVECIHTISKKIIDTATIQSLLSKQYGISLPENVILTLLKRAKSRKLLFAENKVLKKNDRNLEKFRKKTNFTNIKNDIIGKYERLINSLYSYATDNFSVDWPDKNTAEDELLSYLNTHGFLILSSLTSGVPLAQSLPKKRKSKYGFIVASFVLNIEKNEHELFSYFESIVQGNMLASSVYLPDVSRINQKLDETSFYFDTSFIIFALGYAGSPRQNACTELLDLLFQTGAKLYCFEHTLIEIEGVLSACAHSLSNVSNNTPYGYSAEYFVVNNYSEDDVILFKVQAKTDIEKALRIKIVKKPEYDKYSINDNQLDEYLQSQISYKNDIARHRDIDSISAIMRLRLDKNTQHIEECKAVFVTTNYALARASRNYFVNLDSGEYTIPPCVTDHRLTTQIWLKMPTMAPSLSKKRIIADCFASIQPSDNFWYKFVGEIEKLKTLGNITEETYYLLRYSLSIRKSLMEMSLGDESYFDNEDFFVNATIPELLKLAEENLKDKVKNRYETDTKKLKTEINKLVNDKKVLSSQISKEKHEKLKITEEINKKHLGLANRWSNLITNILKASVIVALIVGTILSFPFGFKDSVQGTFPMLIVSISIAIIAIMTILNLCFGTTIKIGARKFESYLSRKIVSYLSNLTG